MRLASIAFVLLIIAGLTMPLRADVKLPAIFGDHMVLQGGIKVPVWGWAAPGEAVTVTAGDARATTQAGADGKWAVTLDALKASDQPMDVTAAGKNTITLHDVLVGDVWICSGQSNMEFALSGAKKYGGAHNVKEELPQANHPTLRLFLVEHKIALTPQADCVGKWEVCTPESASGFSAVGYFFGRDILADQHEPVGLIGTYWGGTAAQVWTSLEALQAKPKLSAQLAAFEAGKADFSEKPHKYTDMAMAKWKKDHAAWQKNVNAPYQAALQQWKADSAQAQAAGQPAPPKPQLARPEPVKPKGPSIYDMFPSLPTILYNGMVAPIIPYAIKGAIWYQGESNAGNPKEYETLFPTMIADWRTRWGEGDFPFIWVQLANFQARMPHPTQPGNGWPGLRDAQTKTLSLPNTGQAVIIDIGQADSVHPTDKMDVGYRLSLAARHVAYGENIVYSGPTFDSMRIEGSQARVKFNNIGAGLTIAAAPATQPGVPPQPPAGALKGFTIAGKNHKFVWATAVIDGDGVVVSSPAVKEPQAVRYGWANNPEVNLYNKEGLPACPFRTDDWK